ncbi:MAG: HDOD domain-containing protein, partial [Gammaproteobacteria bacterium]|nr:HDOD domain-containing protein [Gammaproteobacteria bacterium]
MAANVVMQTGPSTKHNGTADEEQRDLDFWVRQLSDREMPAFASTARVIAGEASRGDQSATELAEVIFQDASMTTRLLRAANSFFYNPGNTPISTVSRAIVLLGFE